MSALPANIDVTNAKLPQSYEVAKAALANCSRLDECQDWADKAAALASYARQADDDTLLQYARRIQSRAVRRSGEIYKQFDARGHHMKMVDGGPSQKDVAASVGQSGRQVKTAVRVANIPQAEFEAAVEGGVCPTVSELAERGTPHRKPQPGVPEGFKEATHVVGTMKRFAEFCRGTNPEVVAKGVMEQECPSLRSDIATIDDWLDRFIVNLSR